MSRVARLGLGLAVLGRPAYINTGRDALPADRSVAAMREATWRVLDKAYAAGIRWVDVARSYGRSEQFLAGWIEARAPDELTVSSKWGYTYVGQWRTDAPVHEVKEHTVTRLRHQLAESTALLAGRIALYQVHSLTQDSPLFDDEPLLDELAALADRGVRVGFSTSGPRQGDTAHRAFELERHGVPVFTAVQSTWNLLDPSVAGALAQAHRAGALVLVKEVLANGRLAVDPPAPVAAVAARHGVGPDAIAVAAALRQPWADTVLLGPAGTGQLASNLDAIAVHLTDTDDADLAGLAMSPDDYWAARARLAWA